eukprot:376059_1
MKKLLLMVLIIAKICNATDIQVKLICDNVINDVSYSLYAAGHFISVSLNSGHVYPYRSNISWATQSVTIPQVAAINCGIVKIECANDPTDSGTAGLMASVNINNQWISTASATLDSFELYNTTGSSDTIVLTNTPVATGLSESPYNAHWIWTCGENGNWNCGTGVINVFMYDLCAADHSDFLYLGCYNDQDAPNRALPHYTANFIGVNATNKCSDACRQYTYFGLEADGQCFCGWSYTRAIQYGTSTACPSSKLGGQWTFDLWAHLRTNYAPIGCFVDAKRRALRYGPGNSSYGFTIDSCSETCFGYKYFAIEDGGQCFCDGSYDSATQYGMYNASNPGISNDCPITQLGWTWSFNLFYNLYGVTGCSNAENARTVVDSKIYACPGKIISGGPKGYSASTLCASGYSVCRDEESASALGLTASMCRNNVAQTDTEFFATSQSSQGFYKCSNIGYNDVSGCAKAGSVPDSHPDCGVLTAWIGTTSWNNWILPNGANLSREALEYELTDSSSGGVLCCADFPRPILAYLFDSVEASIATGGSLYDLHVSGTAIIDDGILKCPGASNYVYNYGLPYSNTNSYSVEVVYNATQNGNLFSIYGYLMQVTATETTHLVVTYNDTSNNISVYVNGMLSSRGQHPTGTRDDQLKLCQQTVDPGVTGFTGSIFYVAVFDYIITQGQVNTLYESYLSFQATNPAVSEIVEIVGGNDVPWSSYPFVVAIVDSKYKRICSGSIVSKSNENGKGVILTAAHCNMSSGGFVKLGCGNIKVKKSTCQSYIFGTTGWIQHKNYQKSRPGTASPDGVLNYIQAFVQCLGGFRTVWQNILYGASDCQEIKRKYSFVNDIALIILDSAITFDSAKVIKLASGTSEVALNGYGVRINRGAHSLGYGVSKSDDDNSIGILKRSDEITSYCGDTNVVVSQICTTGITGSACSGDSGGPTITNTTGEQFGIESYGDVICTTSSKDIKTSVSEYYTWIIEKGKFQSSSSYWTYSYWTTQDSDTDSSNRYCLTLQAVLTILYLFVLI